MVSQTRETTYSLRTLMRTSVTSSGIRNLSFRIYSQFVVFRHRFFVSSSTRNVVYLLYAGLTQRTFYWFFEIPFMLFHSAVDVVCGADFKNAVAFSDLNKVDKILFFQCAILPFVFLQCYYTVSCVLCQAKNTKLF